MISHNPPPDGYNTRTDTSDGSTEMRQNGGTGVTHLAFDRELSLDVDLPEGSSNHECDNTRNKEDRREDDDGHEFCEHADTHPEDSVEIVWNRAVDYITVILDPRDAKLGHDTPDWIS